MSGVETYYSQSNHGPYELFDVGELTLEEGGTLRGASRETNGAYDLKVRYEVGEDLNTTV